MLRPRPAARLRVQAVADQGQAAADLRRDDDLEAVALEDVDRRPADVRLVVVRGAAVEVDDGPVRRRCIGRPARPAGGGRAADRNVRRAKRGQRRPAIDPHDPVDDAPGTGGCCSDQLASGAVSTPIRPVRSVWPRSQSRRRGRWPDAQGGPGPVVHLGDLDVGRAGRRAEAAARSTSRRSDPARRRPTAGRCPASQLGRRAGTAGPGARRTSGRGRGRSPGRRGRPWCTRCTSGTRRRLRPIGMAVRSSPVACCDELGDRHGTKLPAAARRALARATPSPQRSRR